VELSLPRRLVLDVRIKIRQDAWLPRNSSEARGRRIGKPEPPAEGLEAGIESGVVGEAVRGRVRTVEGGGAGEVRGGARMEGSES